MIIDFQAKERDKKTDFHILSFMMYNFCTVWALVYPILVLKIEDVGVSSPNSLPTLRYHS